VLTVGSLFSGIVGFDLGLERAGMRTLWFCEQDPYCRRVLAKHWPSVPCHPDVSELRDPEPVDVLAGGFPCQDLSYAGKGAGINGARSGLWAEYARLIRELRPRYVIVENVPACGYDAEWDCIPASAVGAPHRRDRIWLVAYPGGEQHEGAGHANGWTATPRLLEANLAYFQCAQRIQSQPDRSGSEDQRGPAGWPGGSSWWFSEPGLGRVADGVPARVDRLRGLGNALVPQIAELIGRRILEWELNEA
jgi:DNA (cytosine-5)-methyltransferase 1